MNRVSQFSIFSYCFCFLGQEGVQSSICVFAVQGFCATGQLACVYRVCSKFPRASAWWPSSRCVSKANLSSSRNRVCRNRFLVSRIWFARWTPSKISRRAHRRAPVVPKQRLSQPCCASAGSFVQLQTSLVSQTGLNHLPVPVVLLLLPYSCVFVEVQF